MRLSLFGNAAEDRAADPFGLVSLSAAHRSADPTGEVVFAVTDRLQTDPQIHRRCPLLPK
jgi:hypothetical protein